MNLNTFFLFFLILSIMGFSTSPPFPIIIAHRGDHSVSPENSLQSLEDAIRHGADYVEIDLRTTVDGELIVMHDAKVDRTTTGRGEVGSMTLSQIRELTIVDPHRNPTGHKVPLFSEMLTAAKGRIKVYLDFKEADVAETWEHIKQAGMEQDVVVYINRFDQFKSWRQIARQTPLMVSLPDSVTNMPTLTRFLSNVDAELLDGSVDTYTREMVNYAHRQGRQIWLDVQSPEEGPDVWRAATDLGVDGLQTDHLSGLVAWQKTTR